MATRVFPFESTVMYCIFGLCAIRLPDHTPFYTRISMRQWAYCEGNVALYLLYIQFDTPRPFQ